MEKQVWKYNLAIYGIQKILIPEGYEILTVQLQFDAPCMWVLVDPRNTTTDVLIETFATGATFNSDMNVARKYIGTYQLNEGELVFHVFQLITI